MSEYVMIFVYILGAVFGWGLKTLYDTISKLKND